MKRMMKLSIYVFTILIGVFITDYFNIGFISTAYAQDNTESELSIENYNKTDIAQVFISTNNTITKEEYTLATIVIVDAKDGLSQTIIDKNAKIKLRGNSTAKLKKSPFNFKLSSSQSVLGMSQGKKWCLLANYLDTSLMRNKLAYDFAKNIGLPYSSDTRYVDVWLNGNLQGNYLMAVPIGTGKNKVDINTDKNEFLLELDKSRVEEGVRYINTGIHRFKLEEPKNLTKSQDKWLSDYLSKAEKALKSGNYKSVTKYIDVKTFLDFYIVQELFKNLDANVSSTRFYIKNNKIYAGPLWDCDLSCGNVSTYPDYKNYLLYNNYTGYGTSSNNSYEGFWALRSGEAQNFKASWIGYLMRYSEFCTSMNRRYVELQDKIVNLYKDNNIGTNQIDTLLNQYGASFNRNNELWPVEKYRGSELYRADEKNFQDSMAFLRNWLTNRNQWLLDTLKINNYAISLNANGGKVNAKKATVNNECFYGTLPKATRKGYTFLGWYTSSKEGDKISANTIVSLTQNQILYAHWKKK